MKCWYFRFEGKFKKGDPTFGCRGLFSSCLVPKNNYRKAESAFLRALNDNEIDLLKVIECFDIDEEDLDPEDAANTFWIEWCKETIRERKPIFDKWHVFDE